MDGTRKKSPVIINLVVIASVVGVLASIAVPSYISMQRHARVEQLMKAAGACRDNLNQWLAKSAHDNRPDISQSGSYGMHNPTGTGKTGSIELETFVSLNYENYQRKDPLTQGPLFVVEKNNTVPGQCERDGKIHIIPNYSSQGNLTGATLAVMNKWHAGGPGKDGVLATYQARAPSGQPE